MYSEYLFYIHQYRDERFWHAIGRFPAAREKNPFAIGKLAFREKRQLEPAQN